MSLIERDYMRETPEQREKDRLKRMTRAQRKDELWRLYGKKHKTIFDRMKIRKLEKLNLMD